MDRSVHVDSAIGENQVAASTEKATLKDYYHVTKPGLVYSNVLAAVAGFILAAAGSPYTMNTFWMMLLTTIGITLVIAGGTTLNNVYDRDIDKFMTRTMHRATTTGRISPLAGTIYGLTLSVFGTIMLLLVNPLSAFLGFIGLFFYVVVYTIWLKRTTSFNTVVGAISGAMPPLVGYVAVTGTLDIVAWILFLFLCLWQIPHFLALAMRRVEEYRAVNVPMLPVVAGFEPTKRQIFLYTAAMVIASLLLYSYGAVGVIYFGFATILGAIYIWYSIKGLFIKGEENVPWANLMFRYSVIYLTLILILMMIDAK